MSLRLPDSGAGTLPDGRRVAPSASRNAEAIRAVLLAVAPATGRALELASGTGQHAALLAQALPGLDWQPTDRDPGNLASIDAWAAWSGAANLRRARVLDAGAPGWGAAEEPCALVQAVNLLHLVPGAVEQAVVAEAAQALAPGGLLAIYGPFLRGGRTTSDGDAAFDALLRAQDPAIGYKDAAVVQGWMAAAGLIPRAPVAMPANNLVLLADKAAARA
jgi:SAM-dependent methyltransferase